MKEELRKCKVCNEELPASAFYTRKQGIFTTCKECIKKELRDNYEREVKDKPNTYNDNREREQTFQLMMSLGWQFNDHNGMWYKDGLKDKDGHWSFMNTSYLDIA